MRIFFVAVEMPIVVRWYSVEERPVQDGDREMTMPTRRSAEETGRLGDEIYERDIRHLVEGTHHGEVVAIDVDSGDYAIGENVIVAADRLRGKYPDSVPWAVRVGHRALYHFGGSSLRRAE